MALRLSFDLCLTNNCKKLSFVETTGAYNATNNTTGWGAPNEVTSSALTAVLEITPPSSKDPGTSGSTTYTINLLTQGFPTSVTTTEYEIDKTQIGLTATDKIADGLWIFKYKITTSSASYVQVVKKLFYCQAQCCIHGMFAEVTTPDSCTSCDKSKASEVTEVLEAYSYLKGLIYAANCGSEDKFNTLLKMINKLCGTSTCEACS